MTDNDQSKNNRKTVEDYGLCRGSGIFTFSDVDGGFDDQYLDPSASDWEFHSVSIPEDDEGVPETWEQLNWYAISLSQQAYVTFFVKLTIGEHIGAPRRTEMQYREMIVDNIRAAGGDDALKTIRWLTVCMIVNHHASIAIRKIFRRAGKDIADRGVVEVMPTDGTDFSACFEDNPFTRNVRSLLKHHSDDLGNAFIKRFIFISEGEDPVGQPSLSMITELGRSPTSSQPTL